MAIRRSPGTLAASTILALALAPACPGDPPTDVTETAPSPTPTLAASRALGADPPALEDVDYAGCHSVWLEARPRCIFRPDSPLRLFIAHPDPSRVTVLVDDQPWPVEHYFVDGMDGFGLEVRLPPTAQQLALELAEPTSRWSLPLRAEAKTSAPRGISTSGDVDAALGEAYEASEADEHSEALRLLAAVEPRATRYPEGRADLATYRGVVYWRQGRYHEAATQLRQGMAFAVKLRDVELQGDGLHVYAGILAELGYSDAALDWADQVLASARSTPDRVACENVAKHLSTVAYIHLLVARQRGKPPDDDVSLLLEQALARVEPKGTCPDPQSVPAILLSLADAALDRGDPAAAVRVLADVDHASVPTSDERLRLRDAELRALAASGRPWSELLEPMARLEEAAMDAGTAEARWRLASRRGDLLARRGQLDRAVEAYRQAEGEAQRLVELAAVGVGRDAAVTSHAESTERLIELLVELRRPAEALCIAREAQARRIQAVGRQPATQEQREALDRAIDGYEAARRVLDDAMMRGRLLPRKELEQLRLDVARSEERRAAIANEILQAQSTWRPSCDELVARAPGELLLGSYALRRGWLVLAQDDAGTRAHWLEDGPRHALDDPALGTELLEPLRDRIEAARRVRVLASAQAQAVDVHLLEWDDGRLLEHVPVVYGAELPRRPASARRADGERVALLVADPTRTLRMASTEVLAAAAWSSLHGWTLDVPQPEDADPARILESLARASFFYFAGHGEHDVHQARARALPPYAGGTRDWPARLRLKPPTMLEVQDILMLPSAPEHVALLGCETGVPGGSGGGMSLALAFLVAGAEEVVATPVETKDEIAHATGRGLLTGMSASGVDLAEGLRRAQASMLREGKPVGRYRVWVR